MQSILKGRLWPFVKNDFSHRKKLTFYGDEGYMDDWTVCVWQCGSWCHRKITSERKIEGFGQLSTDV